MSASRNSITHPGIVDHSEPGKVRVRILSQSACSGCHAIGYCSVADVEEKLVEITSAEDALWNEGDAVNVVMEQSAGTKAVILAYVVPLVILVASVITLVSVFSNEGLAALISLALLIPYYFILYLFRDRLRKEFTFKIESGDFQNTFDHQSSMSN